MQGLRVTQLQRHPEKGYWMARVNVAAVHIDVDCRHGSWQRHEARGQARDLLPALAAELQRRVRKLERREARDQEQQEESTE